MSQVGDQVHVPEPSAHPISHYAGIVRPHLAGHPFVPATSRLGWLGLHIVLATLGTLAIARGWGGWPGALGMALVIGNSFAVMAFVAHDTLHGSVVRQPFLRKCIGWLGFLPLTISPTHWIAWHNKIHHGNTMRAGVDPDAFPTIEAYRSDPLIRFGDHLTFGAGRLRGFIGLPIGFTVQSYSVLFLMARQRGYLSRAAFGVAVAETLLGVAFWIAIALLIGPFAFVFAVVIPVGIANAIVMSYIMSNHSLSPLTEVNDPLLNSLSVTMPRFLEILHLGFGMHVEHHIFPAMSPRFAPDVRRVLTARFPGRYQTMPFRQAFTRVFRTAHVYKNPTTMIDPLNGREWSALAPTSVEG